MPSGNSFYFVLNVLTCFNNCSGLTKFSPYLLYLKLFSIVKSDKH